MIAKSYFWPDMTADIKSFVETCKTCMLNKIKRSPKLGSHYYSNKVSNNLMKNFRGAFEPRLVGMNFFDKFLMNLIEPY